MRNSISDALFYPGVDVGDRWRAVHEITEPLVEDHSWVFSDLHFLMACIGAKEKKTRHKLMESLKSYIR